MRLRDVAHVAPLAIQASGTWRFRVAQMEYIKWTHMRSLLLHLRSHFYHPATSTRIFPELHVGQRVSPHLHLLSWSCLIVTMYRSTNGTTPPPAKRARGNHPKTGGISKGRGSGGPGKLAGFMHMPMDMFFEVRLITLMLAFA